MITFQEVLRRLSKFWEDQGCIIHQGYDLEVGAGTMNPATFLRCLGPEPYRAAYIEPCRRPADGRYGTNPNRLQHYFQYQVILKPSPPDMQQLYIASLKAIGIDLAKHDLRFVHDDWENPTIGAWGLGWEVWIDGMEITQYTYFQSVGGIPVSPVTGELTYGIERLAMYLQNVDSIFDLKWNEHLTYGDIYHRNEVEWSRYNFEEAATQMWFNHFNDFEAEAKQLIAKKLPIPAYEFVMKSSHAFNILDARGAISVTERTQYIARIRDLAKMIAESYIASREAAGFPLIHAFPKPPSPAITLPEMPQALLNPTLNQTEDFLLEIGSEELPAVFVPIGQHHLAQQIQALLQKEQLHYEAIEVYGTPRRLAVLIKGLVMQMGEQREEKKGPSLEKAFAPSGEPTQAGLGFFKSIGKVPPASLEGLNSGCDSEVWIKTINGTEYLFAAVTKERKSTAQILKDQLPALVLNLDFPKKMRWSDLDISYARPLRWIVALFGKEVVPLRIGNLLSDRISFGHSQLHPEPFPIDQAKDYRETLKAAKVMVCPAERKESIIRQLDELESRLHGTIIERERVLSQVVHLTEWPQVTEATFKESFLKAPQEVLISEMVEHQKYFPVLGPDGRLLNHFVITADTHPTDHIRKGNQKVLSSRLSDGVFLYEKGLGVPFDLYNEKLQSVTFLKGMGSLHDKVKRLIQHAAALQIRLHISTPTQVQRAAELSKADLVSEMVFEFPELQGIIGHYYAKHHGEDPEVAQAIEEQWMPKGEKDPLPESPTGVILSLADKIDNLICCFASDLKPTSSSDPFALRRQVLGIIKMLIRGKLALPFREIIRTCCGHFGSFQVRTESVCLEIEEFFINRIKTVFLDYGFSKDEVEASLASGFHDIYDTFCKVQALHQFRQSGDDFYKLYEVYKRAKGQINNHAPLPFSQQFLVEQAEIDLDKMLETAYPPFTEALGKRDYQAAYAMISKIQPPLAKLFEEVRILSEDMQTRNNRIALLQKVFGLFNQLLDFSKIR